MMDLENDCGRIDIEYLSIKRDLVKSVLVFGHLFYKFREAQTFERY